MRKKRNTNEKINTDITGLTTTYGGATGKRNLKPIAMPDGDVTTLYLRYEFISDEIKELYDVVSMPFIQCFELSKASGDV